MSQIYHFAYRKKKKNTAGSKAPEDVTKICNNLGFQEIEMPMPPEKKNKIRIKIWLLTTVFRTWNRTYRRITENSILIFQHPSYGMRLSFKYLKKLKDKKHCKLIVLIHDLESLRGGIAGVMEINRKTNEIGDHEFLKLFDAVICHNEHMRQYLVSKGFEPGKVINLDIFDYLSDVKIKPADKEEEPSIAIAGNLAYGKCSYIYKIISQGQNDRLKLHLYGINFDEEKANTNMIYHGSFKPEELPKHLTGDFGLVWDGTEATTCAGNTGEYLKYNNPHKTSLYLSSGMPVIVWSQAAIADYVTENKAGIAVDSLDEIERTIQEISPDEYRTMRKNAYDLSEKLRSGYYTKKALEKAIQLINA